MANIAKQKLFYPNRCSLCGRRWGDHLHSPEKYPGACHFAPLPGEMGKPTLLNVDDKGYPIDDDGSSKISA